MSHQAIILSIAIPAFKPTFFKETLQCLIAQITDEVELIIKDDSPDTQIEELCQQYGQGCSLRYIRNTEHLGMIANWNSCFELMRGKYGLIISDDDLLSEGAISYILEALRAQPNACTVLYPRTQFDGEAPHETLEYEPMKAYTPEAIFKEYGTQLRGSKLIPYFGNIIYKIDLFRESNFYPQSRYAWGIDMATGLREMLKGETIVLPNVRLYWRSSLVNVSNTTMPIRLLPDLIISRDIVLKAIDESSLSQEAKGIAQTMLKIWMMHAAKYLGRKLLGQVNLIRGAIALRQQGESLGLLAEAWGLMRNLGLAHPTILRLYLKNLIRLK